MKYAVALFTLVLVADTATAVLLSGYIRLVETNIDTFDPATFTTGHYVDVYEVTVDNPNAEDATSLEFVFPGPWVNNQSGRLTFRDNAALPMLGPYTIAETFFVLPPGTSDLALAVDVTDSNTLFKASYTVAGTVALIPGNSTGTVVAVLSVPTGVYVEPYFSGQAAIGGQLEPITFYPPEPSALVLIGIASAVYFATSRSHIAWKTY